MLIESLNHDYSKQISNIEPRSEAVDRYWLIPGAMVLEIFVQPGGRLNKKDGLTRYGNSHVKDKTS